MHRKYTIEFTCNFQLKNYPFDLQRCPMILQLKRPTAKEAKLKMNSVTYKGPYELLEYRIKDLSSRSGFSCGSITHKTTFFGLKLFTVCLHYFQVWRICYLATKLS